ncbi:hypothetical protein CES85_5640 [Ochrobactrum quorumnocens]|uniref:Uncharacterized protein n=1 Tax=Ochrobactrum quorumnocens TaxID=271865 RepID=A0A248UDU2_9HYPH|nr:hypothetical protein CES85_5640 [[Ochrobactrum] quorumnocens]
MFKGTKARYPQLLSADIQPKARSDKAVFIVLVELYIVAGFEFF